jgi:PmbA protein
MSADAPLNGLAPIGLLDALLVAASRAGADAADAVLIDERAVSVRQRLGRLEEVTRAESIELGLRVLVGQKGGHCAAIVSTSDRDPANFAALAERAIAMARAVPPDPFAGLAETENAGPFASLDLDDFSEPAPSVLAARAAAAEDSARAVPGVTNTEEAEASWSRTSLALVTTGGFAGQTTRTSHTHYVTALAGQGTDMQRDYDYSSATHAADLIAPDLIGRNAGERAVARLNPVRLASSRLPVVFDPRVAGSLVGHLAGAINGAAVARGTSFLKDRMGQQLFARGIAVHDDPLRPRGLRSRPFDGEGVAGRPLALVEDGTLRSWILDCRSARQLGLATTGHAARGVSSPPSPAPSNLWLAAGALDPDALIEDIREGVYVTELIGMGVNQVTGDYSRGAAGFAIRNGRRAEAVAGITIAGNLIEMFRTLTPASDLEFRRGTDAPTVRIDAMAIAGS